MSESNVTRNVRIISEDEEERKEEQPVIRSRVVFGSAATPSNVNLNFVVRNDDQAQHQPNEHPIQQSDLRLGNVVFIVDDWDHSVNPAVPISWYKHMQEIFTLEVAYSSTRELGKPDNCNSNEYEDMMAICITTPMLDDLGFERRRGTNAWFDKKGIFRFSLLKSSNRIDDYIVCDYEKGTQLLDHNIKYLHQLQNVYHMFTGKELDLKPLYE